MKKIALVVVFVFLALQVYAGQYDNATVVSSQPEASKGNFDYPSEDTGNSSGNFDSPSEDLEAPAVTRNTTSGLFGESNGNFDTFSENMSFSNGNFDSLSENMGDSSGNFDSPQENLGDTSENFSDSSAAEELTPKTVPKFTPKTNTY